MSDKEFLLAKAEAIANLAVEAAKSIAEVDRELPGVVRAFKILTIKSIFEQQAFAIRASLNPDNKLTENTKAVTIKLKGDNNE